MNALQTFVLGLRELETLSWTQYMGYIRTEERDLCPIQAVWGWGRDTFMPGAYSLGGEIGLDNVTTHYIAQGADNGGESPFDGHRVWHSVILKLLDLRPE